MVARRTSLLGRRDAVYRVPAAAAFSVSKRRKKERTGCIKDVGTWRRRRRRALRPSDALYYNAHPAQ